MLLESSSNRNVLNKSPNIRMNKTEQQIQKDYRFSKMI